MAKYQVVDSNRRIVCEPVNTPSRALFLLKAFMSACPAAHYEIRVVSQ